MRCSKNTLQKVGEDRSMKKIIYAIALLGSMSLSAQSNKSANIDYRPMGTTEVRDSEEFSRYRKGVALGSIGTFGRPPRFANNRIDVRTLLAEVVDIGANTYHWQISTGENDFDDLKAFLPLAQQAGIKVWVTVMPPSLARTRPMYCINFERWAKDIATLSLQYPNLVAWSIDDFGHNPDFFSNYYMGLIIPAALNVNPKLAFIPCIYYGQSTPVFVKRFKPFIDGVLFPFRNESVEANLQTTSTVVAEIEKMREWYGPEIPIVLDVYASGHSRLGQCTTEYVEAIVDAGLKAADGVHIFCHQDPTKYPEKYAVLKRYFPKGMTPKSNNK